MLQAKPLITTTEAAAMLGVSSEAVRAAVAAGELAPVRGFWRRKFLLRRCDVEAMVGAGPGSVGRGGAAIETRGVTRG
jgi:excisionase family DNA binding protein